VSGPRAVVVAGVVEPREVARWLAWTAGTTGGVAGGGGFKGSHKLRPAVDGFIPARVAMSGHLGALTDLPAAITSSAIDPRELARWLRVTSSNRLINLDPATLRNTGAGGSTFGGADFCTPIDRLADATEMHMAPRHEPTRLPLFVELCAGTAALSLRLHGGRHCRPPVSRMGAKTGYADAILEVLGLRPGQGADRYLWCEPDDGARLMLIAYTDEALRREAAAIIRGWADEEPRALWERLRDEGAVKGCPPAWVAGVGAVDAREVARWAFMGSASYAPCGSDRGWSAFLHPEEGGRYGAGRLATAARVDNLPDLPATVLDGAVEPREVARWGLLGAWAYRKGDPSSGINTGALMDREPTPTGGNAANARTCGQEAGLWDALCGDLPATVLDGATDPPTVPPGTIVYCDPPYLNTTGYASDLPRAEVVRLARAWADAGAWVVISEQEPIPELMADGWHAVDITDTRRGQKRTFSKQQREWLTLSRPPLWTPDVQVSLW
jgi:hypothetical protein